MKLQNLWTFLLEYSVIQGVILAVILYLKSGKSYLSIFFLQVSYLVFIFLVEYFGWYGTYPHLIWTNVPSWFLISPLLYLHTIAVLGGESRQKKRGTLLHFMPATVIFLYMSPFYFGYTGEEKVRLFEGFYGQGYQVDYVQLCYIAHILFYAGFGTYLIRSRIKTIKQYETNSGLIYLNLYQCMYAGLFLYVFLALGIIILLWDQFQEALPLYIFVFLGLASVIGVSNVYFLRYGHLPHRQPVARLEPEKDEVSTPNSTQRYTKSALDERQRKEILHTVTQYVCAQKLYQKQELRLRELAELLDIPVHHLSQTINQELQKNFFEFINEYRVNAFKDQLFQKRHQQLTLAAIAEECGFKSQSSFYRIFKKETGQSPKAFIKKNKLD